MSLEPFDYTQSPSSSSVGGYDVTSSAYDYYNFVLDNTKDVINAVVYNGKHNELNPPSATFSTGWTGSGGTMTINTSDTWNSNSYTTDGIASGEMVFYITSSNGTPYVLKGNIQP